MKNLFGIISNFEGPDGPMQQDYIWHLLCMYMFEDIILKHESNISYYLHVVNSPQNIIISGNILSAISEYLLIHSNFLFFIS